MEDMAAGRVFDDDLGFWNLSAEIDVSHRGSFARTASKHPG